MGKKTRGSGSPSKPEVTRTTFVPRPAGGGDAIGQTDQRRLKIQRIEEIERLMASVQWTMSKAYELSDAWGVSIKTVEAYAAEASRRIRAEFNPEERKQLKALWLRKVDQAQAECLRLGDLNAHGKMLDLEARALGHFDAESAGPVVGKVSIVIHGPDGEVVNPFPPPESPEQSAQETSASVESD